MKSLSVRDFRTRPAQARQILSREREAILSSNGKPFALVLSVTEDTLDETVAAVRRARAFQAMDAMQKRSAELGNDRLSLAEINRIVATTRRRRRSAGSRRA
jgi:hypothetical protein